MQIRGYVRAAGYEPGDDPSNLMCNWNAVFLYGYWRIVHPHWIGVSLVGHQSGGWIKIESGGQTQAIKQKAAAGTLRSSFTEHYFLVDPEQFVHECCAQDQEWQLISDPLSLERFKTHPYLLPAFFGLNLNLVSDKSCYLHAKDGECKIQISAPDTTADDLEFSYNLLYRGGDKEHEMLSRPNLPRLVLNNRNGNQFSFNVRLPVEGTFKIQIFCGPYNSHMLRIYEARIDCDKKMMDFAPVPIHPKQIGWGPGPACKAAGLHVPTHSNGIIPTSPQNTVKMRFHIEVAVVRSLDIHVNIVTADESPIMSNLQKNVEYAVDLKQKELNISAKIPQNGEYALTIGTSPKVANKATFDSKTSTITNVCNYILSTKCKTPHLVS